MLASIRMRFSPQVQRLRDVAVDRIVAQALAFHDSERGLTVQQIQHRLSKSVGVHLSHKDVRLSLSRLSALQAVECPAQTDVGYKTKGPRPVLYQLADETRARLHSIEDETDRRLASVLERLFGEGAEEAQAYEEGFIRFLTSVFTQLEEE
jgi:hypothetical protein